MHEINQTLLDVDLIPDADADNELGSARTKFAEEDVEGSRFLLVCRSVEPVMIEGKPGAVIHLLSTFHAAPGARYSTAEISIRLLQPEGVIIVDLSPRDAHQGDAVKITLGENGKFTTSPLPMAFSVEGAENITKEYTIFPSQITGSGEGTSKARWTFYENPQHKSGIGHEQLLSVSLQAAGTITGTVRVAARLIRPGLDGHMDSLRDLIFGTPGSLYPVSFAIP